MEEVESFNIKYFSNLVCIFQVPLKLTTHVTFLMNVVTKMVTANKFQTADIRLVHQSKWS
jgi:hypothetical protein